MGSRKSGELTLALDAIRSGRIKYIKEAAKIYGVPRTTLSSALRRKPLPRRQPQNGIKLTLQEEETIVRWIVDLDTRGAPPRPAHVEAMANILLKDRATDSPTVVGKNWVYRFVKRHQQLQSRYTRRLHYQRAQCEDPFKIGEWFDLIKRTVERHGIQEEDIYNFDETGFSIGIASTTRVITQAQKVARPKLVQPGNREWVTVVETICSAGRVLPVMVIFKGKTHRTNWFQNTNLPPEWLIATSLNGWTTDEIGFEWLQRIFEPFSRPLTRGSHRLLILDGHSSHLTPQFDRYCTEHNIVPLCMPPHSSHLLQPLDVGCFSVLKSAYGRQVEERMKVGINHIDKTDFLRAYIVAHNSTFTVANIQSGFRATGIQPFNPYRVLTQLHMVVNTSTPPESRPSSHSSAWSPKTPHTLRELNHQARTIERGLKRRTASPPSPTKEALGQLIKGCQMAIHNAALLAHENEALRVANGIQKQKRAKTPASVSQGGVLTVQQGLNLVQEHDQMEFMVEAPVAVQPKKKAAPRCSACSSLEHTARTCSILHRVN